ncbi:MAG: hypothetical protein ACFE89_03770 [Candidatus Hodarchaeota archaeon]
MSTKLKPVLLLAILAASMSLGFLTSLPNVQAQGMFDGQKLAFYNVYTALPTTNVSVFMDWFESEGGECVNITDLTSTTLDGVTALILNCPDADQDEAHEVTNFTMAQAQAVRDWFLAPGVHKFLWSSSDSSYTTAGYPKGYRSNNASMILEVLGSSLRYEPSSVEDPDNNAEGAYRPFANWTTTDPMVASTVTGVDQVLCHSPTLLYGVDASDTPVALETTTLPNVYLILRTGAAGIINDPIPTTDPMYAHTNGAEGHWTMVAAELGIGGTTNKLVASSCAPIGGYAPMFFDEYKNITADGQTFVKNTIIWGLTPPITPFDPTLLLIGAGVAIVIVIVIVIVYVFMRRRG